MEKIICYDENGCSINSLIQWDKDQFVFVDDYFCGLIPTVQFALQNNFEYAYTYENAVTLDDGKIKITIPNELLTVSTNLHIFLCHTYENSTTTKFVIVIPIRYKPRPLDYIYVPNLVGVTLETLYQDICDIREELDNLLDTTLTVNGKAANSKTVGDKISDIEKILQQYEQKITFLNDKIDELEQQLTN